jgi:hypothetical protein
LHVQGAPVDPTTLGDALARQGALEQVGGAAKIAELVATCTAASSARHHAEIVRRLAAERTQREVGSLLAKGRIDAGTAASKLHGLSIPRGGASRFPGLSHSEALTLQLSKTLDLVNGLIPAGVVVSIPGLPKSGKSLLAMQSAVAVASGGDLLGCKVEQPGPVGVWMQDGGSEQAWTRIQRHAAGSADTLPIRWHVNEGLRLPDDVPALRAEVEREGQRLVILDSLYNFLPLTEKLRDETAAAILDLLKREVCDPTGATVLVVDHAAWPSESNNGKTPRPYGSVFKMALSRATIGVSRNASRVTLTPSGNDQADRTIEAVLDPDTLRLTLVPTPERGEDETALNDRIVRWLDEQRNVVQGGWHTPTEIAKGDGVNKARPEVQDALAQLAATGAIRSAEKPQGRPRAGICYASLSGTPRQAQTSIPESTVASLSGETLPPLRGEGSQTSSPTTCPDPADNLSEHTGDKA